MSLFSPFFFVHKKKKHFHYYIDNVPALSLFCTCAVMMDAQM